MSHAISKGLARYDKVALIGTDLPGLDRVYLENVFKELDRYPVVIGPASDGGFGLIALRKFKERIFSGLRWGCSDVYSGLIDNLQRSGLEYQVAPTLWDVDIPADYSHYELWLLDQA